MKELTREELEELLFLANKVINSVKVEPTMMKNLLNDPHIMFYVSETGAFVSTHDYIYLSTSQQEKCTPIYNLDDLKNIKK